jgi:hypothetical protein
VLVAKNRSEYGQAAFDVYTPVHFTLGFAAGAAGISPIVAALVLTVIKIGVAATEKGMGHALMGRIPGESNMNELCDLLAEIAGVDAGAAFRAKAVTQSALLVPAPAAALPALPSPASAATPISTAPTPISVSGIFR